MNSSFTSCCIAHLWIVKLENINPEEFYRKLLGYSDFSFHNHNYRLNIHSNHTEVMVSSSTLHVVQFILWTCGSVGTTPPVDEKMRSATDRSIMCCVGLIQFNRVMDEAILFTCVSYTCSPAVVFIWRCFPGHTHASTFCLFFSNSTYSLRDRLYSIHELLRLYKTHTHREWFIVCFGIILININVCVCTTYRVPMW